MTKYIIVKYAGCDGFYPKDYKFTIGDSAHFTFTARQVGLNLSFFYSREKGEPWLEKMKEFNPSVYYDLVSIED